MNRPVVFMFSGQGAQYYHMGRDLFNEHPVFRQWMHKLDDVVYNITGESVLDHLYSQHNRRDAGFVRTLYTHPAIFMVEYSLARVLIESGVEPHYVFGASLGEFVSAAIAGAMPVETVLECVVKQARVFENHCPSGGMLAIIHSYDLFRETPEIHQNCELVSVNYHSHFVVAGTNHKLKLIQAFLKDRSILHQVLPVSFAFHSSLIEPAAPVYLEYLKNTFFDRPQIPIISSLSGKVMEELPPYFFWLIARRPIEFVAALKWLESTRSCVYLDLGPSGTLANFTRYNLKPGSTSEVFTIITPFFNQELKNLEKVRFFLMHNF